MDFLFGKYFGGFLSATKYFPIIQKHPVLPIHVCRYARYIPCDPFMAISWIAHKCYLSFTVFWFAESITNRIVGKNRKLIGLIYIFTD